MSAIAPISNILVPIGWAGFDGGLRRAISFARGRKQEDEDQPRRKPTPQCAEDGTLLDLTIPSVTLCGCAVNAAGSGELYNITSDPDDLLGVWQDIPLGTPTTFTTFTVQEYEDECVTPDGDPIEVDLNTSITCAGGVYTLTIQYTIPFPPFATAVIFQGVGALDEVLTNSQECIGSTTFNLPFIVNSPVLSLAA